MDTISLYYPKKEIHVIDYGVAMYISNIFTQKITFGRCMLL